MTDAPHQPIRRRALLAAGGAAAATAAVATTPSPATAARGNGGSALRFRRNGRFRIVQFNDTQDGSRTDRRTLQLMERVLDREKPDFAVINGDVVNGSPENALQLKQAYNNVVQPMESRGIPWAVTFGNHDEDSVDKTGMDEEKVLSFLRRYEYNLNARDGELPGTANTHLLIRSSRGRRAAFALWLLDSHRYAPKTLGGQDFEDLKSYDWIKPEQIDWYRRRSLAAERRNGAAIPSLMFFHIPLWEHHHMWYGTQFSSDESKHAAARQKHQIEGEKNEDVFVGAFNSGLYAAAQERGDVRGIYCGHDHINTYKGNYFGIELGYGPGTGFGTYGLGGTDDHRLRGCRIFDLDESTEGVYRSTRNVFARDLGIDTKAGSQPIDEPLPLP